MDQRIIYAIIVLIIIALVNVAKHIILSKSFSSNDGDKIYNALRLFSNELLNIIDVICYDAVQNIEEFDDLDEFKEFVVEDAKYKIYEYISQKTEDEFKSISQLINNNSIDEYVNKLIEENRYGEIIENIYEKEFDNYCRRKENEVSPAQSENKETDISKSIETFYI